MIRLAILQSEQPTRRTPEIDGRVRNADVLDAWRSSCRSHGHRADSGRRLDRLDNPWIGATPADVSVHSTDDLRTVRMRRRAQQRCGAYDHSRRAVATLKGFDIEKRLLHCAEDTILLETFDGGDRPAGNRLCRDQTRSNRALTDEHGARTALALTAPVLRAGESERIAQHGEQPILWLHGDSMRSAVDQQHDGRHAAIIKPTCIARTRCPRTHDVTGCNA
jgi:hypothetical protein